MSENANNSPPAGGAYAHYALFVLVLVSVFNAIDRNILSILSNEIQRDLGVSDAQMGFLYGTVFALFYAVFGIPLGRFADVWVRRSVVSLGLVFWSAMTALSGFARSFPVLALFRMGVGVGEASASPAAFSMLSDYYPPRLRATAIAIYSSGLYIGNGLGLFLGGYILDSWNSAYPDPSVAPLSLKGWHVAFIAVGLPGILLAIWVRTLREPERGVSEGLPATVDDNSTQPMKTLIEELSTVLPVWNVFTLTKNDASLSRNAVAAMVIVALSGFLVALTGSIAQWVAMEIGLYCVFSWAQSLAVRDTVTFGMIFKARGMRYTMLAFPSLTFFLFGVSFWIAPLLLRLHDVSPAEVGMYVGAAMSIGGIVGAVLGGVLADWFKRRHPAGRLVIGFISALGSAPLALAAIYSQSLETAGFLFFFYIILSTMWTAVPPSTAADLVLPRMRAVAGAFYVMSATFLGAALGPYTVGQVSDMLSKSGMSSEAALQTAMASSALILPVTLLLLTLAWRNVPVDEATRLERARLLGEELD